MKDGRLVGAACRIAGLQAGRNDRIPRIGCTGMNVLRIVSQLLVWATDDDIGELKFNRVRSK
jgi:hypothetical protein